MKISKYNKSFMSRLGGKHYSSKYIIKYIPPHNTYIEPFVGAGSVLFKKGYISDIEIINDLDKDIIDIYKDIKIIDNEEIQKINLDGITREQYYKIKKTDYNNPIDRLYRNLVLWKWSYSGCRASYCTNIRYKKEPVNVGIQFKKNYIKIQNRIKDIIIYNEDYKNIIYNNDKENVFIYIDPPYSKMMKWWHYNHLVDPVELVEVIKKIKNAKFLMTYDDTPENRERYKDFYIKELKTKYCANQHINWKDAHELLIANYDLDEYDK